MKDVAFQQCINPDCAATYGVDEALFACPQCGRLVDAEYDWDKAELPESLRFFESRRAAQGFGTSGAIDFSGVWRFRKLLPFARPEEIVTAGEGRTCLQQADGLAQELGMHPGTVFLQYEGMNPTGSFKDNGMTAATTHARRLGRRRIACASTGNTSASMAMYASLAGAGGRQKMQGIVFIGSGKIAFGKLSQALDYGALTLQIEGDFDACLRRVQEVSDRLGIYLMNSVNPFRLEGQKCIMYRVLEGLNWDPPDWIICPGGNLGNSSAFGKAFIELHKLGLIKRKPRLAIINAAGARTLHDLYEERNMRWNGGRIDTSISEKLYAEQDAAGIFARTVASAIEINRPVNLHKCLRALDAMNGVVRQVDDDTILDHKALVGRYGLGCEPASGASVAGLRVLREEGLIAPSDRVACILTGHQLKDPNATVRYHSGVETAQGTGQPTLEPGRHGNRPIQVPDDIDAIVKVLEEHAGGS